MTQYNLLLLPNSVKAVAAHDAVELVDAHVGVELVAPHDII